MGYSGMERVQPSMGPGGPAQHLGSQRSYRGGEMSGDKEEVSQVALRESHPRWRWSPQVEIATCVRK